VRAPDLAPIRGEPVSARRCWYCSLDDVGLDGWLYVAGRLVCGECTRAIVAGGRPFERVVAVHRGRAGSPRRSLGEVYQAVVTFKERREGWIPLGPSLARILGTAVCQVLAGTHASGRWIVAPVPSYAGRRPHMRVLTAMAAPELPAGVEVSLDLLEKRVDVEQKGLTRPARRRLSANAYAVARRWWGGLPSVRGARVIVTDDLVTTGATMAECARVLRGAGAAAVYGAAIVRVVLAPAERVVTVGGGRQARVQFRELDGRGRAPVAGGSGSVWVRFACGGATCSAIHTTGPFPVPTLDRTGTHRWLCQCGAMETVQLRREWLGGQQECVAVMVGSRAPAEVLVGIAHDGMTL
jgi:predicted amidophosphoribosyltransferase